MHPENPYRDAYPMQQLSKVYKPLHQFLVSKPDGQMTINFSDPDAVKALNTAMLEADFGIKGWSLPKAHLCPAIPGRLEYLLHVNELLNATQTSRKKAVRLLDIGTGASAIYPLLAHKKWGWDAVGSDISQQSLSHAKKIIAANKGMAEHIHLRKQPNANRIFSDVIGQSDSFDVSVCNPPFYRSLEHAQEHNQRKTQAVKTQGRNFAGQLNELVCDGGEVKFIQQMIKESHRHRHSVKWFTTLVSQKQSVQPLKRSLKKEALTDCRWLKMSLGNKVSRILAWTYQPVDIN